jgi:hypothetical protein
LSTDISLRVFCEHGDRPTAEDHGNAGFPNRTFGRARRELPFNQFATVKRCINEWALYRVHHSAHPIIEKKCLTCRWSNLPKDDESVTPGRSAIAAEQHQVRKTQIGKKTPRAEKALQVVSFGGSQTRSLLSELLQIGHRDVRAGSTRAETDPTFAVR